MTATIDSAVGGWLSRFERFDTVTSTNDIVARWLREGTPEVCVAIADVQTAGRGRSGRAWEAPAGVALLLSAGFRPAWLEPGHAWRLGAIVSLAMAEACEVGGGVRPNSVRLKWPNDLVVIDRSGAVLKLAGVLGETDGLGTGDARAVIGIGLNADWKAADFPPGLAATMTSLAELVPGMTIDREVVTDVFLDRLAPLVSDLRGGAFPADAWRARQLTSGAPVSLELPDGSTEHVMALDVDTDTGALVVTGADGSPRHVLVGEIRHLRPGGILSAGV